MANSNGNNNSSSNSGGNNNSGSSGSSSGTISNSRDVEERLAFLEREANYWRVKFEELEKWRENLEDWVIANIGVPNRARTPASNSNNNNNNNNSRWIKSSPNSQLSSPSNNGWSPDSSDASTSVNNNNNNNNSTTNAANNFQAKSLSGEDGGGGRRSTYDFDSQEDNTDDNTHGVAKRKRGRPKKNPDLNPPANNNFPNGSVMGNSNVVPSSDMKSEGSEMNHWGFGGESGNVQPAVPVKRGRGRPRKIKTDEEDDDKERKKPGRKKRDPVTLLAKACDLCGMEFESNQDLMSHKRIVHPDKFHKCTVCNETYLHPGFLARHMETHTLDRDFKCHMCISSFNTYQLLKLHCTEKHGVEVARQCDWKRDGELSIGMNRVPMDSYGLGQPQQQQQQQQPPQSSSSIMSPSVPNCGIPGNDLVRNDLMNPHNVSSHQQFMQQQQRQQQQHAAMMQQQQQHHNHLQQQIHSPHHMHLQQQQQQNPAAHPHHSQHLQHQQSSLPHNLHHNHNHNHQNLQHQQQQQQLQHSFSTEDEDENDIDGSGFSLDFACNGSETLPSLFDPAVSDTAMGNYLNSIEPDSLQLY